MFEKGAGGNGEKRPKLRYAGMSDSFGNEDKRRRSNLQNSHGQEQPCCAMDMTVNYIST